MPEELFKEEEDIYEEPEEVSDEQKAIDKMAGKADVASIGSRKVASIKKAEVEGGEKGNKVTIKHLNLKDALTEALSDTFPSQEESNMIDSIIPTKEEGFKGKKELGEHHAEAMLTALTKKGREGDWDDEKVYDKALDYLNSISDRKHIGSFEANTVEELDEIPEGLKKHFKRMKENQMQAKMTEEKLNSLIEREVEESKAERRYDELKTILQADEAAYEVNKKSALKSLANVFGLEYKGKENGFKATKSKEEIAKELTENLSETEEEIEQKK